MEFEILERDTGSGFKLIDPPLSRDQEKIRDKVRKVFAQPVSGLDPAENPMRGMVFLPDPGGWAIVIRAQGGAAGSAGSRWIRLRTGESALEAWKELVSTTPCWESQSTFSSMEAPRAPEHGPCERTEKGSAAVAKRAYPPTVDADGVRRVLAAILESHSYIQETELTDDAIAVVLECLPEGISQKYVWSSRALIKPECRRPSIVGPWPKGSGMKMMEAHEEFKREWPPESEKRQEDSRLSKDLLNWLISNRSQPSLRDFEGSDVRGFVHWIDNQRPWEPSEYIQHLEKATSSSSIWDKVRRDKVIGRLCEFRPDWLLQLSLERRLPDDLEKLAAGKLVGTGECERQIRSEISWNNPRKPAAEFLKRTECSDGLSGKFFVELDIQRGKIREWLKLANAPKEIWEYFAPINAGFLMKHLTQATENSLKELLRAFKDSSPNEWEIEWWRAWKLSQDQDKLNGLMFYLDCWSTNSECPLPPKDDKQFARDFEQRFGNLGDGSSKSVWSIDFWAKLGNALSSRGDTKCRILRALAEGGYIEVSPALGAFLGIPQVGDEVISFEGGLTPSESNLTEQPKALASTDPAEPIYEVHSQVACTPEKPLPEARVKKAVHKLFDMVHQSPLLQAVLIALCMIFGLVIMTIVVISLGAL